MVSINTKQAYSEIDEFLSLLDEDQKNKIPEKLRTFFKEEKDNSYHKNINPNVAIEERNLKEETLAIIALLNLQYLCNNEEEKKRLQDIYAQNEKEYQEKLYEQYNPNDIFKKKNKITEEISNDVADNMQLVEYKEPIFKRIINKIMEFFHIKK